MAGRGRHGRKEESRYREVRDKKDRGLLTGVKCRWGRASRTMKTNIISTSRLS